MTRPKRERLSLTCKKPYTGSLAKPLEIVGTRNSEGSLGMTDEGRKVQKAVMALRRKAVLEMFEIDSSDPRKWEKLARSLFENCVPGAEVVLIEPSKKGRPKKYEGDYSLEQFALRVDSLVNKGFSRDGALLRAGKEFNSDAGLRSLRNMYAKGKIRWAMLIGLISTSEDDEFLADLLES